MTEKKPKKTLKREIPLRNSGEIIQIERPSKTLFDQVARQLKEESENSPTNSPLTPPKSGIVEPSIVEYSVDKHRQDEISKVKSGIVETSPSKNFTKFSNSLVKQAIPEKYFRGQSKHTYDVLYQRTRGAINPVRQIQLTKNELIKLTGLAEKTVQLHIRYLKESGLLMNYPKSGSHNGWIYEIFIPEELSEYGLDKISVDKSGVAESSTDQSGEVLSRESGMNLTTLDYTNLIDNKDTYGNAKTSFKTNTNDDDAFTGFRLSLDEFSSRITGKTLNKKDEAAWLDVLKIILMEIELAASRTGSISNLAAFAAEHLRRRFNSKALISEEKKEKGIKLGLRVGKTNEKLSKEIEEFIPEALSEEFKYQMLGTMKKYIEKGEKTFVMSLQENYTTEDWQWLMENLEPN